MAGPWIKMEIATAEKPEVMRMARMLGIERDAVLGKLYRLWGWFDVNSVDGFVDGVVSSDVDELVDAEGFAEAMAAVGWLELDDKTERLVMPNFDNHNGESAKKRASKSKRQQKWRESSNGNVDGSASTKASTRGEEIREDKNKDKYSERFLKFWAAYPVKKAKGHAWKAWKKINPNDQLLDQMLAALKAEQEEKDRKESAGKFVPEWKHPATWLNAASWEDEPEPPRKRKRTVQV